MPIKFGTFTLSQVREPSQTCETLNQQFQQFLLAEQLGFSTVWIAEHLFSPLGVIGSTQVLAAAIARATTRIRIGTAVNIVAFNHPLRTASDFAAIDCMSNGRLNYGTGRAYQPTEFDALGLDISKSRALYHEGLEIILKAWEGKPFTYDGEFWKIPNPTAVHPPLVQRPHPPLYTGAQTRESFIEAGSKGVNILMGATFATRAQGAGWVDDFAESLEAYDGALRAHGYDPARMERGLMISCHVAETAEEAKAVYGPPIEWSLSGNTARRSQGGEQFKTFGFKDILADGGVVVGDVDQSIRQLNDLRKRLRLTEIILEFNKGGIAHSHVEKSMRLFMEKVAPFIESTPELGLSIKSSAVA